jgi:hypothetical protein
MNMVAFLEFAGLVFDTSIILEDELEVGPRTPLDKIDCYSYGTVSSRLRYYYRPYIPFK